ncbi:hypothetical protein [Planctomonas psychrotolerans]|uniref:hypothetical protein n=1 Tax=Planctomonas psychrotolerans TaxID=2528712 RepID=UPI00123946D0|nr:hypothetical protein [Planctomonas psychrotolerans]
MDDVWEAVRASGGGLIHRENLLRLGVTDRRIEQNLAAGKLVRVAPGVYEIESVWRASSSDEQQRTRIRAVASGRVDFTVCRMSAAAMYRIPSLGGWPARVSCLDPSAQGGSSEPGILLHRGPVDRTTRIIDDVVVTGLARTLVDIAAHTSFLTGVIATDHALRYLGIAKRELYEELTRVNPRYGRRLAARVIDFAVDRSWNVFESLSRVRMYELGFASPELQVDFADRRGFIGSADFYWPEVRTIGESDGLAKYSRAEWVGDRVPADVVVAEKIREDRMRALGNAFTRWTWDVASSPARFAAHLSTARIPRR